MAVKVKMRQNGKEATVVIPGFNTMEELKDYYDTVVNHRIMEQKFSDMENWLDTEVICENAHAILNKDIHAVMREDQRRGGPGGNEPCGKAKDRQLAGRKWRNERDRNLRTGISVD